MAVEIKQMNSNAGFSLVEIILVIGILAFLVSSAFLIGLPEYDRYVISSERQYLVDTLLESQARSAVGNVVLRVNTWSNGYCIQDLSGLCIVPSHILPPNLRLTTISSVTSTKMILSFGDTVGPGILQTEVNLDENGFIEDQ